MNVESSMLKATTAPHRPRIALVAPSMDILGGQGVQAYHLQKKLLDEGYEVLFIPVNLQFPKVVRWLHRIPYLRTVINELLYIPSLLAVRHVDVVHVFSASYWSFLLAPVPAMLMARLFGRYLILNYHSGEAEDHLANWGYLVHPWLLLPHEIIVPSTYLQEVFSRYRYKTRVIRNIVNTAIFKYRERTSLQPRLLSVRNLEPHYRVDVTILAFALLKHRYPGASLTIVGYGGKENRLKQLVKTLNVEGIRFLGRVEQAQMPGIYDDADIFVNSSVIDNQPVSILEAFAAGLVVVTTGTGDISAMVSDTRAGYIVPTEDPKAMADTLVNILEQPGHAIQAVHRAREEVGKYAWTHVCSEWTRSYLRMET